VHLCGPLVVRIDGRTVELAARVPGARVVELAPVADAAYVAAAITDALGVAFDEGETAREALLRHLARGRCCEQVLDAAPLVGELLARAAPA
jgi:predicted ATPase